MRPLVSVIVPVFNEELVITEMHNRLTQVLSNANFDYEILLINDGSDICATDRNVKLISFSRNFGHQIAITAGIDKASGHAVVIIDADLQDPPELIPKMVDKWREGYEVVYGVRRKREGEGHFKLITAALFYRTLRRMTPVDIPVDTGDFRLIDRKVVEQLRQMKERTRFVRGMVSWVGFRQCKLEYLREKRFAGETKYPFKKMLKFAMDGILSFSQVPLKLASAFGFLCSGIGFLALIYGLIIKYLFPRQAIPGWASLFVGSLFLGGVQLICLGVIGEYLGRIYEEVKQRPLYIADEEINFRQ
jgi:polyisoprenyl-phosphate glycosyltransferase